MLGCLKHIQKEILSRVRGSSREGDQWKSSVQGSVYGIRVRDRRPLLAFGKLLWPGATELFCCCLSRHSILGQAGLQFRTQQIIVSPAFEKGILRSPKGKGMTLSLNDLQLNKPHSRK